MAKIIFLCAKDNLPPVSFAQNIKQLSRRLNPDNIATPPPLVLQDKGIAIGIFNPSPGLAIQNHSVCMGNLIRPREDWWKPYAEVPDGTYGLFRSDGGTVEVISDMLATRTIWYIQTDRTFMASTSQRAILSFCEEFKPNAEAYPWMLSSGTLGPGLSWDSRIQCLAGNSRLILDRGSWQIQTHREPVRFYSQDIPDDQNEALLRKTIRSVFDSLDLDFSKWILSLSGGIDSRAMLLFLKDQKNLKCITWGLQSSLQDKKSDAFIARKTAEFFDLQHEFFATDLSGEPFEAIFNRFLVTSEGRIDNIAGYMDGFRTWKFLHESGYHGIFRGDIAFGNRPVSTTKDVHKNVGLITLSDFDNLTPIAGTIEKLGQKRPDWLAQKEDENLEKWRDRLNAEFEIPFVFAALTDIKLSFTEVINPFLSRVIVQQVRRLPDHLRTDKNLFRKIVASLNPDIPFAQHRAIAFATDCLKQKDAVDCIIDEISSDRAKDLLPEPLIRFILKNMKASEGKDPAATPLLHRVLRPLTPKSLRRLRYRRIVKHNLDPHVLGFRACLICKMTRMLSEDARYLT